MPDATEGVEKQARSVALPTEDGGEQVIAQQNAGPEAESGSGEWPSPQAAPTGPAPGTTPEGVQAASRREQAPPQHTSPEPGAIRKALSDDPVAGGSSSVPDDDQPVDTSPG